MRNENGAENRGYSTEFEIFVKSDRWMNLWPPLLARRAHQIYRISREAVLVEARSGRPISFPHLRKEDSNSLAIV